MSFHASPDTIALVALHLPECPLSATQIWKRQRDPMFSRVTFKQVLDSLVRDGRAKRIAAVHPGQRIEHRYYRVRHRPQVTDQ